MTNFLNDLPIILLALPGILLSLSVHEASHGYAAYKLGDPTAKNLGRLTLNPIKHINIFGFICMLFFNVGWANPVPVNTRNFKNSKKGMAITAAAGPLSNLCLAIISLILLRLLLIPIESIANEVVSNANDLHSLFGPYGVFVEDGETYYYIHPLLQKHTGFVILSVFATMLSLNVALNFNLMIFNLIPLPPLDGSRIAYLFLPTDTYFKVMRYEIYIQMAFIFLMALGMISLPLNFITGGLTDIFYSLLGIEDDLVTVVTSDIYNRLPTFSF